MSEVLRITSYIINFIFLLVIIVLIMRVKVKDAVIDYVVKINHLLLMGDKEGAIREMDAIHETKISKVRNKYE